MTTCLRHIKYKRLSNQRNKRKLYFGDREINVLSNVKQDTHQKPIYYAVLKDMYV